MLRIGTLVILQEKIKTIEGGGERKAEGRRKENGPSERALRLNGEASIHYLSQSSFGDCGEGGTCSQRPHLPKKKRKGKEGVSVRVFKVVPNVSKGLLVYLGFQLF